MLPFAPPPLVFQLVDHGMAWISRIRIKTLAWVLAIVLAGIATVSLVGGGWVPVVGVALAAAAMSVSRMAAKLDTPRCMNCGHDMAGVSVGVYGVHCPACGSIHDRVPTNAPTSGDSGVNAIAEAYGADAQDGLDGDDASTTV